MSFNIKLSIILKSCIANIIYINLHLSRVIILTTIIFDGTRKNYIRVTVVTLVDHHGGHRQVEFYVSQWSQT